MTHTYTFAVMPVSRRTYDEIAAKMREANYDHAFTKSAAYGEVIDLNGIAIAIKEETMGHHFNEQGEFQSDKHPDLPPDRIRLNLKNPRSVRALRALAEDYREADPGLSEDLTKRLDALHPDGESPSPFEVVQAPEAFQVTVRDQHDNLETKEVAGTSLHVAVSGALVVFRGDSPVEAFAPDRWVQARKKPNGGPKFGI